MKYLDITGLQILWGHIKTYINKVVGDHKLIAGENNTILVSDKNELKWIDPSKTTLSNKTGILTSQEILNVNVLDKDLYDDILKDINDGYITNNTEIKISELCVINNKLYIIKDNNILLYLYDDNTTILRKYIKNNITNSDILNHIFFMSKAININPYIEIHTYPIYLNINYIDLSNVTDMSNMFLFKNTIKILDISNVNTLNVTNMSYMFANCKSLEELDISHFDTSNVKYMGGMFNNCESLISLNIFDLNTKNVTDMSYMFNYCSSIEKLNVNSFRTSNVTNMEYMFSHCQNLNELVLSTFDVSNVITMQYMFNLCISLTELDLSNFITTNVTDMSYMFNGCWMLETLDLTGFITDNVYNMGYMFTDCDNLTELIIDNWNLSNVINTDMMFFGCYSLSEISGTISGLKISIDLSTCPLSNNAAMKFINGLDIVSDMQTIKFSSSTYNTLTTTQITLATNKGWSIESI